jgi:hypothetical protein
MSSWLGVVSPEGWLYQELNTELFGGNIGILHQLAFAENLDTVFARAVVADLDAAFFEFQFCPKCRFRFHFKPLAGSPAVSGYTAVL